MNYRRDTDLNYIFKNRNIYYNLCIDFSFFTKFGAIKHKPIGLNKMSLKIQILDTNGANIPTPRKFPAKGDRPERTVYEQKAYIYTGGVFPVEFKITHDDFNDAYAVGDYTLATSSFKVNQYGQLELDRFGMSLVPLADFADKKAS